MTIGPARARDLGLSPGVFSTGPLNAITDVGGIRVGHTTVSDGGDVNTGVTAIVPDGVDQAGGRLPAGIHVANGYGKLIGATQLVELGAVETPILLTGTLSAFRVADALVTYMLGLPGNEKLRSLNPLVGETNDGYLSDIRSRPVTEEHVLQALTSATPDNTDEGCVGAGTGTVALGFKAGVGTSSRVVDVSDHGNVVIGALVQSNFSGTLTARGVPIPAESALGEPVLQPDEPGNSCMIVVAVDRGLDSRQLTRVAKRAVFGMSRAGSDFSHGSGDYAIALSVSDPEPIPDEALDPIFLATQDVVEEAILNSLFMAKTTVGYRGNTRHAVPLQYVLDRCRHATVAD